MNVSIPIELASHEVKQLDEFIPRIEERLREIDLEDEADEISDATIVEEGGDVFSAKTKEWAAIIGGLRVLRGEESLRSWWLRKKLARRVSEKVAELDPEEEASEDDTPGVEAGETTMQDGVSA